MDVPIDSFSGYWEFLSNFYPAEVELDGAKYPSVEHAYQAAKTTDAALRSRIAWFPYAGQAKRAGRKIMPLRSGWDQMKLSIMESLLTQKFAVGTDLAARLLATGERTIIEGNTWGDVYWGICRGEGTNHMGLLLMKIRKNLREA